MKRDIQIVPNKEGDVTFEIIGAAEDSGLLLLQRLYILMLSSVDGYRYTSGNTLLSLLDGANAPSDGAMNSMLAIGCANAVEALDEEDRVRVASFTGQCTNGTITCSLDFADGTTLKGIFTNG
jgi:hypothetical protein